MGWNIEDHLRKLTVFLEWSETKISFMKYQRILYAIQKLIHFHIYSCVLADMSTIYVHQIKYGVQI